MEKGASNKRYLYLLFFSLLIGGYFSLFASAYPDGLERVAKDKGFLGLTLEYPVKVAMPDYVFPYVNNDYFATGLAGLLGTLTVFLLICFMAASIYIFRSRSDSHN